MHTKSANELTRLNTCLASIRNSLTCGLLMCFTYASVGRGHDFDCEEKKVCSRPGIWLSEIASSNSLIPPLNVVICFAQKTCISQSRSWNRLFLDFQSASRNSYSSSSSCLERVWHKSLLLLLRLLLLLASGLPGVEWREGRCFAQKDISRPGTPALARARTHDAHARQRRHPMHPRHS